MTIVQLQDFLQKKYFYPIYGFHKGYQLLSYFSECSGNHIDDVINYYSSVLGSNEYKEARIYSKYLDLPRRDEGLPFAIYALATNPICVSYEHFKGKTADYAAYHILHEVGHHTFNDRNETNADKFALKEITKLNLEQEILSDDI